MNILPPSPTRPIIDADGEMEQIFRAWTQSISRLSMLEGSGSPEGVENALPTRQYMDTAGIAGAILYIKRDADILGDTTKGWVLV